MLPRHFTRTELADIRQRKIWRHSNAMIARKWRRESWEIDVALFALLGRSSREASDALCKRGAS